MKREEEIKQVAQAKENELCSTYQAFVLGATWADKTFLDKACKWLKEEFYDTQDRDIHPEVISSSCDNVEELIEDFRKAMEE